MPYRVLNGLSYPPDRRAEVGDIVDDLPPKSVKWLLAKGHIEEAARNAASTPAPSVVPVFTTTTEPEEGDE